MHERIPNLNHNLAIKYEQHALETRKKKYKVDVYFSLIDFRIVLQHLWHFWLFLHHPSCNPGHMKKQNLKDFDRTLNTHFTSNVQTYIGTIQRKIQQNERQIQCGEEENWSATPSNWPWYKIFDSLFANTSKIIEIPQGVD